MFVYILFLGACSPTCDQVCDKISTCLNGDSVDTLNCTSACRLQQIEADDDENALAFDNLKQCIYTESCADLETGICYDESLYAW